MTKSHVPCGFCRNDYPSLQAMLRALNDILPSLKSNKLQETKG